VPVTTGPQDPAAAGRDRLRAGHADREQVIEALKDAFVHGRLTKDELDARAGQAFLARTNADLAALTADIPPAPATAAARPARPPAPGRRRPLARTAAGSGVSLVIAAASMRVAFYFDPDGAGLHPYHFLAKPFVLLAVAALLTALGILIIGVAISVQQRHSRGQLPPRPGPGGHDLEAGPCGGAGDAPVPPGLRSDQTRTDLRASSGPASGSRRYHWARVGPQINTAHS
jgi:Domain of unknown function (DUF1707)